MSELDPNAEIVGNWIADLLIKNIKLRSDLAQLKERDNQWVRTAQMQADKIDHLLAHLEKCRERIDADGEVKLNLTAALAAQTAQAEEGKKWAEEYRIEAAHAHTENAELREALEGLLSMWPTTMDKYSDNVTWSQDVINKVNIARAVLAKLD